MGFLGAGGGGFGGGLCAGFFVVVLPPSVKGHFVFSKIVID